MKFSVGQWLVSVQENLITRKGTNETVKLEPRVMDVLVYMTSHPGKVISRDELIEHVWKGRIVGDHAIYRIINQLRKSLNPDDKDAYVKTVPKKGYQFVVEVEREPEFQITQEVEPDLESVATISRAAKADVSKLKYWFLVGLAGTCLLVTTLGYKWLAPKLYLNNLKPFSQFTAFSIQEGEYDDPSISANGKFVVYAMRDNQGAPYQLYKKNLQDDVISQLTTDDNEHISPKISNDGQTVIYISYGKNGCAIKKLIEDKNERELVDCSGFPDLDIDISSDARTLFYTFKDRENVTKRIFSMDVETGRRTQLTNFLHSEANGDHYIEFDASNKLYFLRNINNNKTFVYEYDLNENVERLVFESPKVISKIKSLDDSLFYQYGDDKIYQYSLKYEVEEPVLVSLNDEISDFDVLSDEQILLIKGRGEKNLFESKINQYSDKQFVLNEVVSNNAINHTPEYANTSNSFAFVSQKTGINQIWIKREGQSREEVLTKFLTPGILDWLKWSPSDKYIVTDNDQGVYLVQVDSGELELIVKSEDYSNVFAPSWSTDGSKVYFTSDATGAYQLYSFDLKDRTVKQVSDDGIAIFYDQGSVGEFAIRAYVPGVWKYANQTFTDFLPRFNTGNADYLSLNFKPNGFYQSQMIDEYRYIKYLDYTLSEKSKVLYSPPAASDIKFSVNHDNSRFLFAIYKIEDKEIVVAKR